MDVPAFVETFDPVYAGVILFTVLVVSEMVYARMTGGARFEAADSAASLAMGFGNLVSKLLFSGFLAVWFVFVYEHRFFDIGFAWWAWILAFVLDDFVYYWSHRFAHTVRWFWADHVVHHSSQHYNLTTALRQPWLNPLTLKFLWLGSALILLGFHPAMIAFVGSLNLIYQFWIHTEAIKKCPAWFEAVMNTPSHHRVHHATNPRYLDTNYAGVFIVWDKMFGTFVPELDEDKPVYGIVKPVGSYNPFTVAFHEFIALMKDCARDGLRPDRWLGRMINAPGWSPDGHHNRSVELKRAYVDSHPDQAGLPGLPK